MKRASHYYFLLIFFPNIGVKEKQNHVDNIAMQNQIYILLYTIIQQYYMINFISNLI